METGAAGAAGGGGWRVVGGGTDAWPDYCCR